MMTPTYSLAHVEPPAWFKSEAIRVTPPARFKSEGQAPQGGGDQGGSRHGAHQAPREREAACRGRCGGGSASPARTDGVVQNRCYPVLYHVERLARVGGECGLHLRAAQRLGEIACAFSSVVRLSRVDTDDEVDGKSILGILSLGAACGDTLFIRARGGDAEEAAQALQHLVEADSLDA